jgi:hypothetical protein
MTVSQLIDKLKNILDEEGDLPLLGGYLHDDSGIVDVLVDTEGCDISDSGRPAHSVFLQ